MTILYIDDDSEDHELFSEAVTEINCSYQCISAFSGREGLKMLNSLRPDQIFLDLNMPEMNGKEVLTHIRAEKKLACIPVIIFSTSISAVEVRELTHRGATRCIVKPCSFQLLCKTLQPILSA
jgi:CheY-like chemotaxis protein